MMNFIGNNMWFYLLMLVWILPWKACALWFSARRSQKVWFIIFLITNTFGLLEIVYIFFILKKKPADLARAFKSNSKITH